MLIKSISICNKHSLYNGDGDWKAIIKAVSRALAGTCEKHLDKLINDTNDWGRGGSDKHKRIVQELCEKIFKKKGYENQKDALTKARTTEKQLNNYTRSAKSYLTCVKA